MRLLFLLKKPPTDFLSLSGLVFIKLYGWVLFQHTRKGCGSRGERFVYLGSILSARHSVVGTSAALTACNRSDRANQLAHVGACGNGILTCNGEEV